MPDWEAFYRRFREPDFVPGYEIQNRLGGGAFGEVFKARKRSIGKAYAIKFLKLDEASKREAVERELEQVRLFAAIDHPHLVTIEDMGVVSDVPYLIMGYAGEETLARRLKRGDLTREEAVRYFVQTCRGVLALHDRRLAHFDLKPSNVFLKGDVARVGDYGLAKLLSEGQRTLSFGRGTPHYMAPEMFKNRADHRADVYSLGALLYESLTGKVPFAKDESAFGVLLREDDEPPAFPDDYPARLRAVTERCLRLDPGDRYQDVNELLADLGQSARQGDSIRLPFTDAAGGERGADGKFPSEPAAASEENGAHGSGRELRTAAAELARGAALVARGMWDGVVAGAASDRRPREAPEPDGAAPAPDLPAAGGSDVVSVRALGDPDAPAPPSAAEARASRRGVLGILERVRRERASGGPEGLADDAEPLPFEAAVEAEWERDPRPSASVARARTTIPVPPRGEGGLLSGAVATLVLGLEVMVSLVSGPILLAARALGRAADRLVRRVPGLLGSVLRLGFFVLFFFLFGAVVTFALLLSTAQW